MSKRPYPLVALLAPAALAMDTPVTIAQFFSLGGGWEEIWSLTIIAGCTALLVYWIRKVRQLLSELRAPNS
jgi:hypothetical protein